jgi:hypothetical protein
MLGSIALAGVVLKAGSIFCNMFCLEIPVMAMRLVLGAIMLISSDRKVVMAYSSVVHISCCVISFGLLTIYGGFSHVVVSPLIFVIIYVGYQSSGSRVLGESFCSLLLRGLLLVNLGFPLIGAFYCEAVWFCILGWLILPFLIRYFIIGVVSLRIFYATKGYAWYHPSLGRIMYVWTL